MKVKSTILQYNRIRQSIFLMVCAGCLLSCSTATKITGSWRDPEAKSYKDFLVAVLTKNLPARTPLERDISSRLKHERVKERKV